MDTTTPAAFLAVDLLLVFTPGADWAYAISAGLRGRTVVPAVTGLIAGHAVHALVAVAGLAVIVASSPAAQTGLLSTVHLTACAVVYLAVGVLARTVLSSRPSAARAVTRVSGAMMIAIGGFLLVGRLAG
ncbi:hypothetical protein [Streptomyces anulatus]|uniref:hypothetical protein n=1 Tax=Streptomyces anulatus TaxID=1892 RepID=UPI0033F5148B